MQLLDRRPRRDSQLLAKAHPKLVIDPQCLGDVSARGEHAHQQRVRALAVRRERDQTAGEPIGMLDFPAADIQGPSWPGMKPRSKMTWTGVQAPAGSPAASAVRER